MQNSLPKKAQSYLKEHLREKRWKQVVTVLACVVVFCTTYALILPALTMTGDTYCGKEAHQHSDERCWSADWKKLKPQRSHLPIHTQMIATRHSRFSPAVRANLPGIHMGMTAMTQMVIWSVDRKNP